MRLDFCGIFDVKHFLFCVWNQSIHQVDAAAAAVEVKLTFSRSQRAVKINHHLLS